MVLEGKIQQLRDNCNKNIFPVTTLSAVFNNCGLSLEEILDLILKDIDLKYYKDWITKLLQLLLDLETSIAQTDLLLYVNNAVSKYLTANLLSYLDTYVSDNKLIDEDTLLSAINTIEISLKELRDAILSINVDLTKKADLTNSELTVTVNEIVLNALKSLENGETEFILPTDEEGDSLTLATREYVNTLIENNTVSVSVTPIEDSNFSTLTIDDNDVNIVTSLNDIATVSLLDNYVKKSDLPDISTIVTKSYLSKYLEDSYVTKAAFNEHILDYDGNEDMHFKEGEKSSILSQLEAIYAQLSPKTITISSSPSQIKDSGSSTLTVTLTNIDLEDIDTVILSISGQSNTYTLSDPTISGDKIIYRFTSDTLSVNSTGYTSYKFTATASFTDGSKSISASTNVIVIAPHRIYTYTGESTDYLDNVGQYNETPKTSTQFNPSDTGVGSLATLYTITKNTSTVACTTTTNPAYVYILSPSYFGKVSEVNITTTTAPEGLFGGLPIVHLTNTVTIDDVTYTVCVSEAELESGITSITIKH